MAELQLEFLGIPIFPFLCGVGVLLLSLCYLKRNPHFPIFWKERDINQKHQSFCMALHCQNLVGFLEVKLMNGWGPLRQQLLEFLTLMLVHMHPPAVCPSVPPRVSTSFRLQGLLFQRQGRAKRRRKGGTSRGWRTCQSEAEDARKVLSLLQSPLGQHHDTIRVRQLLCPDPFCEVCNSATAEVNRLLFLDDLEDDTPSVSSLASTASATESSFTLSSAFSEGAPGDQIPAPLPEPSPPPPSILSPNPMTPLADCLSPSSPGHSLLPDPFPPLDSKCSADHSPPLPLAFPSLPPKDTQTPDPILPSEDTLSLNTIFSLDPTLSQNLIPFPNWSQTMNPTDSLACHHAPPTLSVSPRPDHPLTLTRSKSVSILLKPVPENSSPDRPAGLATCVPTVRGTDHSNLSISEFSCWQAQAKNMFFPTLSHADFQRQHVSLHLPETCLWADSATKHMEASSHSFFGLNIQALLARQMKRRTDFNTFEKKEKEEALFSKQMWSQKQQTSSGNSLKPSDLQDTTDAKSGWDIKGKPEQLRICQQLLYVKTLQENLQQKYSQLFWGLPSLHSESLVATLLVSSSSSPLESPFVLFNGICNVSAVKMWDQEFPPLPRAQPLPLPSVHPQPLPQTLPQSQHLPFTQVQPQAHLQSPLPILPASPSQIRNCGVSFQRPQNESDSHISTENQHLEWHVLQKQQESLRGVVPGFQKSQEAIFPRAPKPSSVSQSSHAYVPVSILPGHFHITSEPQEKLELHAPRRLIPHCCLHTCRNLEFLALREPQCKFTETSQQKGRHAHSQLSELHSQSSEDLAETELSLPGSFHGRIPTNRQLRKDMRRNLGYILEKSPEDSPQRVSECYLVKGLRAASETKSNCVWHSSIQSGNEFLNVSRKDIDQNEIKTILTLHLSKKFWQITEGRIPLGVCLSWLADDKPSAPPGSSHTNMKSRDSKNTIVGRVYHQITTLELSFLDPNTRQVLEAHIIRFRVSQRWGLPLKVLESIKFYKLRDAKTRPLPQFDFLSSATCISGVDSKAEVSKPLQGSSQSFQGNKVRTTNSVPILDHPLPATSSVGNEGRGALKPSHSDTDCELAEDVQTTEHGRQTLEPLPHSIKDEVNQSKTVLHKRCSPEVPTRQAGAGHEPSGENVGSSERVQTIQGQKTVEKKLEHFSMSAMNFREIFKAEELCALKSQSCDILTTSELRSSQMVSVNTSKVETTLTTECPSPKIPLLQDSKLPDLKKQLHNELKFQLKSRGNTQAQACHTDMSFTLDSLPSNSSLTQSQSISSGDMGASQVLHVHLEDNGDWQQPWVSKYVLCKCQHMNFPPAAKRVRPLRSKAGECGSEDSGAGTSKARQKRHPVEDTELEDTSLSLSQNEQLPPESYFRKKMRQFFQWLSSKRTITGQESPQQKAKFISTFAQHQDPAESAALLESCGPPEAHELMIAIGKILEEKLARRYEPEPSEFSQQKEELQAQVEPDKAHPSNYGALSDPQQGAWAGTKSCSQVSADQS